MKMLDLFAGSGVGVAAQWLGIEEMGVEIMPDAIKTRELNGMNTIYNDVWDGLLKPIPVSYDILWASPPCQTFSVAGKGTGRKALDDVIGLIHSDVYKNPLALKEFGHFLGDDRTALVLTPLSHVWRDSPAYVAFEQVPTVLPVWQSCAAEMQKWGYSTWTGILNAQDYAVAQSRKRAYLIARKDGMEASSPPAAPISRVMSDVLDIESDWYQESNYSGGQVDPSTGKRPLGRRRANQPSATVTSKFHKIVDSRGKRGMTTEESAVLQSYPFSFQFFGKKSSQQLQIGNAVPPLVAKAVLEIFLV